MTKPDAIEWHLPNAAAEVATYFKDGTWRDNAVLVKRRRERRSVFRIEPPGSPTAYFVKHDHPRSLRNRIKCLWRCKSKAEYDTARELNRRGVRTVRLIGWGACRDDSYLVTEAVPDATRFESVWNRCRESRDDRRAFIPRLAEFIASIANAGVCHADFHPGNVLVRNATAYDDCFFLVDFSNITFTDTLKDPQRYHLILWLYDIFGELARAERLMLCRAAGIVTQMDETNAVWSKLGLLLMRNSYRRWPNRRARLLPRRNRRQCHRTRSGQWLRDGALSLEQAEALVSIHRNSTAPTINAMPEILSRTRIRNSDEDYIVVEVDGDDATVAQATGASPWITAHRLRWHGINLPKPLAWLQTPTGRGVLVLAAGGVQPLSDYATRRQSIRPLILEIAKCVGSLHNYRIALHGLHADRIGVVPATADDRRPLVVLEYYGIAEFGRALTMRKRCSDLRAIVQSLPAAFSTRDRLRIVAIYAAMCGIARPALRESLEQSGLR